MHARSAVFDLYGDHLLRRGGWAPVSSVVRLLGAVGVAAPAARTAISRMTREGWLMTDEREGVRGYAVTERAQRRLSSAYERIYATSERPWGGGWDVIVLDRIADRSARTRLNASLEFLGYARLSGDTWIAARRSTELADALGEVGHTGLREVHPDDPQGLAARLWDLSSLADQHTQFARWADHQRAELGAVSSDEDAYVVRSRIVHEWRKFLFRDPALPAQILPADWPGRRSAAAFHRHTAQLEEAASAFVTAALTTAQPKKGSS